MNHVNLLIARSPPRLDQVHFNQIKFGLEVFVESVRRGSSRNMSTSPSPSDIASRSFSDARNHSFKISFRKIPLKRLARCCISSDTLHALPYSVIDLTVGFAARGWNCHLLIFVANNCFLTRSPHLLLRCLSQ